MFDSETSKLLRSAPSLSGLDSNNFPLFFTRHYAELSMARLRGHHEVDAKTSERWTIDKIADAYELIASLDTNQQVRKASAFVAATAHQILSRRIKSVEDISLSMNIGITQFGISPSISSALLFMISEQYADAHEAAQSINTVILKPSSCATRMRICSSTWETAKANISCSAGICRRSLTSSAISRATATTAVKHR